MPHTDAARELDARFKAENDDYSDILLKALADRLAELAAVLELARRAVAQQLQQREIFSSPPITTSLRSGSPGDSPSRLMSSSTRL